MPSNLRSILNPQVGLINVENGLEEADNNLNNNLFNPAKKTIEEKIAEYIAILTKNLINESYFLYDKSNLIKKKNICYCNQQAIIALWFFKLLFRSNYSHKFKTDQLK